MTLFFSTMPFECSTSTGLLLVFGGFVVGVIVGVSAGSGVGWIAGAGADSGDRVGSERRVGTWEMKEKRVPGDLHWNELQAEKTNLLRSLKQARTFNNELTLRLEKSQIANRVLTKIANRSRNRNSMFCDDALEHGDGEGKRVGGFVVGGEYAIVRAASCEM
jgi:hypothetical protein